MLKPYTKGSVKVELSFKRSFINLFYLGRVFGFFKDRSDNGGVQQSPARTAAGLIIAGQ